MRKVGISILAILALTTAVWCAIEFQWASEYVEETILEGEGWGVIVGESAAQTVARLRAQPDFVSARIVVDRIGPPAKELFETAESMAPEALNDVQRIAVLDGKSDVSILMIEFKNDRVVRIHMRRRAYDL